MDAVGIEVMRLMVFIHHSSWAVAVVGVAGVLSFLLATRTQNATLRRTIFAISAVAITFFMATGLSVGPMDDWQHQHGTCLLESLKKK